MIKGSDTATLLKNDFHSRLRKSPLWGDGYQMEWNEEQMASPKGGGGTS